MRAALAAAILLAVALAGCSTETHRPDPTTTGPSETGSPPPREPDSGVFQVDFESDAPATLEVPFPHLDACLQPEDWMNGTASSANAVPEVRDASGGRTGRVLAVSGQGAVHWAVQVNLTGRPPCQPIRHDPWSVDPDPADGTVDVRVADGSVVHAAVLVRWIRSGCGEATLYDGRPAGDSWSALSGTTIPAGCY